MVAFNRVYFYLDLLEQGKHSLLGHSQKKVDCHLSLLLVQSLQIVKKVVLLE